MEDDDKVQQNLCCVMVAIFLDLLNGMTWSGEALQ